jgi:ABC-type lipoprotein export system ATPase subunit
MSKERAAAAPLGLDEFLVEKLHSRRSLRLTLRDSTLVLVGENGAGKTTVINLLYYFLSRQWPRLAAYDFVSVGATIRGRTVTVTKEMLSSLELSRRLNRYASPGAHDRLRHLLTDDLLDAALKSRGRLIDLAHEFRVPARVLEEFVREYAHQPSLFSEELDRVDRELKDLVDAQILYLPTYRRIEQELRSIFPDIEESTVREHVSRRRTRATYVDLVEFGMEDVERAIEARMTKLKDSVRASLNNLATTYLRDVIGGDIVAITSEAIDPGELANVESVLGRIDDKTLPPAAKERLRSIVSKFEQRLRVEGDERVIALFLFKLVDLYRWQQSAETSVRSFTGICNRYLVGKRVEYDSDAFTISIRLTEGEEGQAIALKQLSSGEKQIVSLFSHLYLSDLDRCFVLIDEPELSLSVAWQETFLPDIRATDRCVGMVAVTHSPFVFANELDLYARNLNEFWYEAAR